LLELTLRVRAIQQLAEGLQQKRQLQELDTKRCEWGDSGT
jgi:hypothetical protein